MISALISKLKERITLAKKVEQINSKIKKDNLRSYLSRFVFIGLPIFLSFFIAEVFINQIVFHGTLSYDRNMGIRVSANIITFLFFVAVSSFSIKAYSLFLFKNKSNNFKKLLSASNYSLFCYDFNKVEKVINSTLNELNEEETNILESTEVKHINILKLDDSELEKFITNIDNQETVYKHHAILIKLLEEKKMRYKNTIPDRVVLKDFIDRTNEIVLYINKIININKNINPEFINEEIQKKVIIKKI